VNNPHSLFSPRGIHIAFGPRDTTLQSPSHQRITKALS